MNLLFTDVETTGLPIWREPSESPDQPHIVEICADLTDSTNGADLERWETIIRPDGWVIPDEVTAIHGITTEQAMDEGIPEAEALDHFLEMLQAADVLAGHNISFEQRILRIALKRYLAEQASLQDTLKAHPVYCTCRAATDICKLPPTEKMIQANRGHQFKAPKLEEAVKHFFGEDFPAAHRARPDVDASKRIYFAINPIGELESDQQALASAE